MLITTTSIEHGDLAYTPFLNVLFASSLPFGYFSWPQVARSITQQSRTAMVGKANIRHNFGVHDEMPVDDIAYKRTGGCFVSHTRFAIVSALIVLLFAGLVVFVFNASVAREVRKVESD